MLNFFVVIVSHRVKPNYWDDDEYNEADRGEEISNFRSFFDLLFGNVFHFKCLSYI